MTPSVSAVRSIAAAVMAAALGLASSVAHAGGPLSLFNNQAVVYPGGGAALTLRLDLGPLGTRSNAQAVALVQSALAQWNAVTTSTLRVSAGAPLATDYTSANFAAIYGNYSDGINPVLFDTDGSIIDALLGAGQKTNILGIAGSNYFTGGPSAGKFGEGNAVINGFLNVSDGEMINVVAHEIGHFFGMDHAQLDASQGLAQSNFALMYPIIYRTLGTLHEDDAAAVSSLYPSGAFGATYGHLEGVFTTAGGTPVRGANLWASETGTGKVYSVVSDFLKQGTGYFRFALPAGTYTLHAESIHPGFVGGSSVGPYAESAGDISFVAPHPIAPVVLGGGGGQAIAIVAGCTATGTFRLDGTGSVTGNCAAAAGPGTATISANPYGAISVQGATLVGNAISGWTADAVIQLGATAGTPGSLAQIDFQGLSLPVGTTLAIRSGAAGQTVRLDNATNAVVSIDGTLVAQSGNGAPVPQLHLRSASGIAVNASGRVVAPAGLAVETLGASWTIGQTLVNQGTLDGGPRLDLLAGKINGGGSFKGDAITVATFGNANNPVNGAFFLANSLQLFPSTGSNAQLLLNAYGPAPQFLNIKVNGNATVAMPSAWLPSSASPPNNAVVSLTGSRPAGVSDPVYGGGSMIVQATGTLGLDGGTTNDFVFPGGIVLKSGGTLDANGVLINNGWTTSGKSFQGVFFESPNIVSTGGNIRIATNNLNWLNFSTTPTAPVRSWQLVRAGDASASFATADNVAPHINTYSVLINAAAEGQCWVCLVNTAPANLF